MMVSIRWSSDTTWGKQPNAREAVIQGFVQAGMPGFLQGGFEAKDFVVTNTARGFAEAAPFSDNKAE